MAYIGRDTDKLSNIEVLDTITFDGSSSYTLQKNSVNFTPSSANNVLVSIDGVVQANNFTVSGSTIDFGVAVPGTSTCDWIYHIGVGLITTPADGTVTTAKLADSSVTSAKLASGVGGKVLQVVSTTKQDTFSASITATGFTDVTGLSVSITPSSASNKILILCYCTTSFDATLINRMFIQLKRGGTAIQGSLGTQVGSNRRQTITIAEQGTNAGGTFHSFNYLDSPSSTSALTYQIAIGHGQGDTRTIYVNRSSDDADANYICRASSTITVMEIAG
jgi:hypothetical protein